MSMTVSDEIQLSFLAEDLGNHQCEWAIPYLLRLAEHNSAIVREGVVIGLQGFITIYPDTGNKTNPDVHSTLVKLTQDESPGVSKAAFEALEDLASQLYYANYYSQRKEEDRKTWLSRFIHHLKS